jgi:hypothetical protein
MLGRLHCSIRCLFGFRSRVQGFKGSRVQGFKGSRVQGFKGSFVLVFFAHLLGSKMQAKSEKVKTKGCLVRC